MKKMAYYGAAFLFIISYLGVTETTVFNQSNLIDPKAAIWSPVFIIGFALTLLVAMIPTIDSAYDDMVKEELKFNGKGPYNGILGKLKWFFLHLYICNFINRLYSNNWRTINRVYNCHGYRESERYIQ